jgi:hypothetical protein
MRGTVHMRDEMQMDENIRKESAHTNIHAIDPKHHNIRSTRQISHYSNGTLIFLRVHKILIEQPSNLSSSLQVYQPVDRCYMTQVAWLVIVC